MTRGIAFILKNPLFCVCVCLASFLEGNKDGSLRQMALGAGEVFQNLDFWGAIWCLPPALKRRLVEVGADVVKLGCDNTKQTGKLEIGKKYILQKQKTTQKSNANNLTLLKQ